MEIIGNKEVIAVEIFENLNNSTGKYIIWINNIPIGYPNEVTYFSYLLSAFSCLKMNFEKLKNDDFQKISVDSIFRKIFIESSYEFSDYYKMQLGESFDDFYIACLISNEDYIFIWKIIEEPFFTYEKYPKDVQHFVVSISYVEELISQLDAKLSP